MWFRKRKPADPAGVVSELRERALTVDASELQLAPAPGHEQVWGMLMEIAFPEAVATLVSFADGTTSLYFSNGGGTIGAGTKPRVRAASDQFVSAAHQYLDQFAVSDAHPLPSAGRVRFYARTFDGLRTAEASAEELGGGRHALSRLFYEGQKVITAIRET